MRKQPSNPQAAEGWAAFKLGLPFDMNPYRKWLNSPDGIQAQAKRERPGYIDMASEWSRGWTGAQLDASGNLD